MRIRFGIRAVQRLANRMMGRLTGFQISRCHRARAVRGFDPSGKFEVGCGENPKNGYIGCDIRKLPGVSIVCKAWEVSKFTTAASEIYARHTVEHLSLQEMRMTFEAWHKALRIGGKVHIIVPNLEFHIAQWKRIDWANPHMEEVFGDARYALAGFYGWQRECDPAKSNYNNLYWDVHKMGLSEASLRYFLEEAGFTQVQTSIEDEKHLIAVAEKRMHKSERQVAPILEQIRLDHRERYERLLEWLPDHGPHMDIACGIGYGCKIIASSFPQKKVIGADRDEEAITYARQYYGSPRGEFIVSDVNALPNRFSESEFSSVSAFEIIEHLEDPEELIRSISLLLRPGGVFALSSPNQSVEPFSKSKFPHHERHFTLNELTGLLQTHGFTVNEVLHQTSRNERSLSPSGPGIFMMIKATSKG